jgi:hypothetical protein
LYFFPITFSVCSVLSLVLFSDFHNYSFNSFDSCLYVIQLISFVPSGSSGSSQQKSTGSGHANLWALMQNKDAVCFVKVFLCVLASFCADVRLFVSRLLVVHLLSALYGYLHAARYVVSVVVVTECCQIVVYIAVSSLLVVIFW